MGCQEKHVWANIQDISEVQTLQKQKSYCLDMSWLLRDKSWGRANAELRDWPTARIRSWADPKTTGCRMFCGTGLRPVLCRIAQWSMSLGVFRLTEIPWNSMKPISSLTIWWNDFQNLIFKMLHLSQIWFSTEATAMLHETAYSIEWVHELGGCFWWGGCKIRSTPFGVNESQWTSANAFKDAKDPILHCFPRSTYDSWCFSYNDI